MKRVFRSFLAFVVCFAALSGLPAHAETVTRTQVINAAANIIISNEGVYDTVLKCDVDAVSIGLLGWHATKALDVLKQIAAANQNQAVGILGVSLYNEIVISNYWEGRILTSDEAYRIKRLLATTESVNVQNQQVITDVESYIIQGENLGIRDPATLVFFADARNQLGYYGVTEYFCEVRDTFGTTSPNLDQFYACSSKNWRRQRTYEYCKNLNWPSFSEGIRPVADTTPPGIADVSVLDVNPQGYTITFRLTDADDLDKVYVTTYYTTDGQNASRWVELSETTGSYSLRINAADFGARTGSYTSAIYAFDKTGNYSYSILTAIQVPAEAQTRPEEPVLQCTVATDARQVEAGEDVCYTASARGGSGNYLYLFELSVDGKKKASSASSDLPVYTVQTSATGSYVVSVTVTDEETGKTAKMTAESCDVYRRLTDASVTPNKTQLNAGERVTWSATAAGGEGAPYTYSYALFCNGELEDSQSDRASSRYSYTPKREGVYTLTCQIRDSRNGSVITQSSPVAVYQPLTAEKAGFDRVYALPGMQVTCKAETAGGHPNKTCSFTLYKDGAVLQSAEETNENTYSFTVTQTGVYTFTVTVASEDETVTMTSETPLVAEAEPVKGDANCDGKVLASDARFVLRCSARLDAPVPGYESLCDVDGDGRCLAKDARLLLRYTARLEMI